MGITLKSSSDLETMMQDLHGYFLLLDSEHGTLTVGTYEIHVHKQNKDGTCEVQPVRKRLSSGDVRYKNFAQTNRRLLVEILAQKEQVKNPTMTREQAVEKAEELYTQIIN